MKHNTLDLDTTDKEFLTRIMFKVMTRSCFGYANFSRPSLNGWHFDFMCKRDCDLCRFLFDDPMRYEFDKLRPEWSRNVLFDKKELVRVAGRTS